ncbi:50S ribosomal protein L15 [Leadbetterella sp. DM7]|uniref:50S ribosomal protein L15 n=1 Tax=Leadbetterella sp. DM7 TaxID=3235085 RepID=UPI00349E6A92
MKLESLKPAQGSVKSNTRLGRGQGSGGGGTAKRGHKGAKSRSGYSQKRGFEGGQMPLQRRVPKFGFNNVNRVAYKAINLDTLQALFEKTGEANMTLTFLREHGLASKSDLIKVLGRGEFTAKVNVTVHAFSKSAEEAIAKAGGSATVFGAAEAAGKEVKGGE